MLFNQMVVFLKLQNRIKKFKEETEHLKQQVSAYKEDFETERKDRENAHSVIAELKNQIKIMVRAIIVVYRINCIIMVVELLYVMIIMMTQLLARPSLRVAS